jgi:hypothetical protein
VSHTTTINVDEEKLKRIKRAVQNIYNDSRSLNELMGDAAESFDAEAILEAFTRKMGWETIERPSLREVEERRPTSTEDSTKIISKMKKSRTDRVS